MTKDRIDVGLMPNSSSPPRGWVPPEPPRLRWPWITGLVLATIVILIGSAAIARAEGETVNVRSVDCQGIIVNGGGYTAGQTLLTFARTPQGEGTITEQKQVKANADGMMPSTTLKFGGKVPDGTYQAVITTPGGPASNKEEVIKEFQVKGCLAGAKVVDVDNATCQVVAVSGTGWAQTNATVEVQILGETEMKQRVQPDARGRFSATLTWPQPPQPGLRTVEVLVDNIKQAEANFQITDCSGASGTLPFTGPHTSTIFTAAVLLLAGVVILLLVRRPRR